MVCLHVFRFVTPWEGNAMITRLVEGNGRKGVREGRLNLERLEGRILLSAVSVASHDYGDVKVTLYDADDGDGTIDPDVAWTPVDFDPGTTDVVVNQGDQIVSLYGDGTDTEDLGIVIENDSNGSLQNPYSLRDLRSNPTALGFLAVEGGIHNVSVRADIAGANLNAFSTDGDTFSLPDDVDDDGTEDDLTAIYSTGDAHRIFVKGAGLGGDTVIGGSLGLMKTFRGDVDGDLKVGNSARLIMGVHGNVDGNVTVGGNLGKLMTVHGDITSNLDIGESARQIMAVHGSVDGDVMIGTFSEDTVDEDGNLGMLKTVHGSISGDVEVGGNAGLIMAIHGNIAGNVKVGGNARLIKTIHGDIGDDEDADSEVVNIVGDVGRIQIIHGSLHSDLAGEADMGDVTVVGGGINGAVGIAGNVRAIRARGGDIEGAVNVGGNAGLIAASGRRTGGAVNGDVEVEGHLRILAAGGDLTGDVTVTGILGRVSVRGDMGPQGGAGPVNVSAENIFGLQIRGHARQAHVSTDGLLAAVRVRGDFDNSTVDAGRLRGVMVGGLISEDAGDGDTDHIRSGRGPFFVGNRGGRGWAGRGPRFGPRWFGGVRAFVGNP